MGKVRRCNERCHNAKGTRCKCWCGGAFHGSAGVENRAALTQGVEDKLDQHGFKKGETAYIEQKVMPLEVESVG